jgi:5-methylcytosine-specific restriction endonuclease McrA
VKRGGQLRRLTPLQRRTPLRPRISDPYVLRKAKKIVKERSGGRCEARIPSICTGRASEVHHVKSRARGGSHNPDQLLDCCSRCHFWITTNPRSAHQMGFLKHSWENE